MILSFYRYYSTNFYLLIIKYSKDFYTSCKSNKTLFFNFYDYIYLKIKDLFLSKKNFIFVFLSYKYVVINR